MSDEQTPLFKFPYPYSIGPVSYGNKDLQELAERLEVVLNSLPAPYSPGDLKWTANEAVPGGWLLCNGQAANRTTNKALFEQIGTAYGAGNGTTTFNVPNTEGCMLRGAGVAGGTTIVRGQTGGQENVKLTGVQSGTPLHVHPWAVPILGYFTEGKTAGSGFVGGTGIARRTGMASAVAAAASHTNMPPWSAGHWLIKT